MQNFLENLLKNNNHLILIKLVVNTCFMNFVVKMNIYLGMVKKAQNFTLLYKEKLEFKYQYKMMKQGKHNLSK